MWGSQHSGRKQLKKLRRSNRRRPRRPGTSQPRIERLEQRALLAGDLEFVVALGSDGVDIANAVATDTAGNIYISGRFNGTVDFDPGSGVQALTSAGGDDVFAAKYTSDGSLVWARRWGGMLADAGYGIAVDDAGNVYTTGDYSGTVDFDPGAGSFNLGNAGSRDIFISKLDATGNFLWARRMGAFGDDAGLAIAVDGAGNVHTTGRFISTVDFDPTAGTYSLASAGDSDIFVQKLDTNGNFLWARRMGNGDTDAGQGIAVDALGHVYTTGRFLGTVDFDPGAGVYSLASAGGYDVFVQKLDASGNLVWAGRMGGSGSDWGNGIALDSSGNAHVVGFFNGSSADFDPGSGTFQLVSAGLQDVFVAKLDAGGNFAWARRMGGADVDQGQGIAVDGDGNVYTTGRFSGSADFDPGAGTATLVSAGGNEIFLSKLDANGDFVLAHALGGSSTDNGLAVAAHPSGEHVYLVGSFEGTADFDPGSGTHLLTSAGLQDAFLWKMRANSAPTDITLSNDQVDENSTEGTLVGELAAVDPDSGDTYTFLLLDDAGGRFVLSGTQLLVAAGADLDHEAAGSHEVLVRATDSGGLSVDRLFTILVTDVNEAPAVVAGGDATLDEGSLLARLGAFSDPELQQWTATVDFGDGSGLHPLSLAADQTFELNHVYADNGNYTVTVTVTDDGGLAGSSSFNVAVNNVAPTITAIEGPAAAARGQSLSFTASFQDPGAADTHTRQWQLLDSQQSLLASGEGDSFSFSVDETGSYTVVFSVSDDDGGSDTASQALTVGAVELQLDPCDGSRQSLIIGGTEGDDQIEVTRGTTAGHFLVSVNGVNLGSFAADPGFSLGRIVVYALGGHDDVEVAGDVNLSAWLFGGSGNDRLKGGSGHDLLFGGDGHDILIGGSGRDLLVGGTGEDRIVGNAGDDILVAGSTAHDTNDSALCALMAEWTRTDRTYEQRVSQLEQGVGDDGSVRLDAAAIQYDSAIDLLTGSSGHDWFFFEQGLDTATDLSDEITGGDAGGGWIMSLYSNLLGRVPSLQEWNHWRQTVDRGMTYKQIAEGFLFSRERRREIINDLYHQYLGRSSDDAGVNYWIDVWNAHGGPEYIQAGIIGSREYQRAAGNTDHAWVSALYRNVLGREVDQAGIEHWVKHIRRHSKESVVLGFVTSDEYRLGNIKSWFRDYLGRSLDKRGADYWLDMLRKGTQESIQMGILSSAEYRKPD